MERGFWVYRVAMPPEDSDRFVRVMTSNGWIDNFVVIKEGESLA